METSELVERVVEAMRHPGRFAKSQSEPPHYAETRERWQARAALAALGLDDWEAAVDRGGHAFADWCQDRFDFRPALGQRDIASEIVLRAALGGSDGE